MNKIKVALVDTGINTKHEFLKSAIASGYGFRWKNEKVSCFENFYDVNGHGTACASVILNECSNVEFIVIKALNCKGRTNLYVIEKALESIIDTDVSVINMSFAVNKNIDSNLYEICNELVRRNKILISSLSNDNSDSYPAYFDNVLGVRGFVLERKNTIWFDPNKKIQCIVDNNLSMCCNIKNTYEIKPRCNSLATAKLTGILCRLISNEENISIHNINFNSACTLLQKYSSHNTWSKKDLYISKRYPNERDWYIDDNHFLLKQIFSIVKEKIKIVSNEENLCNYKMNGIGGLNLETSYAFIKYISESLNIKINYMDITRDDLLTIGSITKFFEKYI